MDPANLARNISSVNRPAAPEGMAWLDQEPDGFPAIAGNFVCGLVPELGSSDYWVAMGDEGRLVKADIVPFVEAKAALALCTEATRLVLVTV